MITSYSASLGPMSLQAGALPRLGGRRVERSRKQQRSKRSANCVDRASATAGEDLQRYLPVTGSEGDFDICLLGFGRSSVLPGEVYPNVDQPKMYRLDWRRGRVLPEFQVVLLTDARGEFESEATGRVEIDGDVVLFLFPGVWHRFRPDPSHGWNERWMSLNSLAARRLCQQCEVSDAQPVAFPENAEALAASFDVLFEFGQSHPSRQSPGLSELAAAVLLEAVGGSACATYRIAEGVFHAKPEPMDPIVEKSREIIWNHGHLRSLCVSEIARHLPVTRRTLDRRFAQTVGHSVLDEINACRLWRAKRLLEETDLLIKTISYFAGFPSRERMRLLFLSEEGVAPTEYRDRYREWGRTQDPRDSSMASEPVAMLRA